MRERETAGQRDKLTDVLGIYVERERERDRERERERQREREREREW